MKWWLHAVRRLRPCQSGAAAIEFAIIAQVMIFASLGVIEFGRGLYVRNQLSYVADFAARKILIGIADGELEAQIREEFHGGAPERLEITLPPEDNGFRAVQLSYPVTLLIPAFAANSFTISVVRLVPVT